MEVFFAAMGKTLLSLTGPIGRHAWRRSGWKHMATLAEELATPSEKVGEQTRLLVLALKEVGLSQADLIQLSSFCRSHEGEFSFRLIAINAITGNRISGEVQEALVIQVAAMIRLYARDAECAYADSAARLLVPQASVTLVTAYNKLKSRDPVAGREVHEVAVEQSRLPALFHAAWMRERSASVAKLATQLPTQIEDQIATYRELVRETTATLKVSAVGRSMELPIDDAIVNPRVCLLDDTPVDLAADEPALPTLLARHNRVALLGDPGGGKSTAVRSAVHEYAMAEGSTVVPFVVVLRKYARDLKGSDVGFVQYITNEINRDFDECINIDTIRYLLDTGRAVVFFDGLDEVLDIETRVAVVERIDKFGRRFTSASLVVASREIGYEQAPVGSSFTHLKLQEFNTGQVRVFAANIFRVDRDDAEEAEQVLERFMLESRVVADIRCNPLLLGILCYLFASGHTMPTSRLDLYRKSASLLFETWDSDRGLYTPLKDPEAAEAALREVALEVFQSGVEEFSEDEVKTSLSNFYLTNSDSQSKYQGRAFADDLFTAWSGRRWILIYAGDDDHGVTHFRFAHRTFLEYFAAEQISFNCETATDAWDAIKNLVTAGAATPLCQLVVQMMAAKTRGSGNRILELALGEGVIEESAEEYQVRTFYKLAFFSAILGSFRTESETRDNLFREILTLFGTVIPWITVEEASESANLPFLGYRSAFFGDDDVLIAADRLDDHFFVAEGGAEDSNIDGVSVTLKGLMHLSTEERARLLAVGTDFIIQRIRSEPTDSTWLRLAMTLYQVGHFESWRSMPDDWRSQVTTWGESLWKRVLNDRELTAGVATGADGDFWLLVALLRDQGIASAEALERVAPRGLFVGSWPMPVLGMERGTLAHTLALATLGLLMEGIDDRWTRDEIATLAPVVCASLDQTPVHFDRADFQVAPNFPIVAHSDRADLVSPEQQDCGGRLFDILRGHMGDSGFTEAVKQIIEAD
jgi:hypothetical protein